MAIGFDTPLRRELSCHSMHTNTSLYPLSCGSHSAAVHGLHLYIATPSICIKWLHEYQALNIPDLDSVCLVHGASYE